MFASNPGIVNTALAAHSNGTRTAVQGALSAGNEVTIHERPVTISGWSGAGYIAVDPATGAGGYLIEGGCNGGFLSDDTSTWGAVVGFLIGFAGMLGAIASAVIGVILAIDQYLDLIAKGECAEQWADLSLGWNILAIVGAGIAGLFVGLLVAVAVGLLMLYMGLLLGVILSMAADYTCKVRGG